MSWSGDLMQVYCNLPNSPHQKGGTVVAVAPIQVAEPITVEVDFDEIIERYLEIRNPVNGEVVTVVEILLPKNKRSGEGRTRYEQKRAQMGYSATNLVEIDLLRAGKPMFFNGPEASSKTAYRILVSRSQHRPKAELYPFGIREAIPRFKLPLKSGDDEPVIDLNPILQGIYQRASYDLVIDYKTNPTPPLSDDDTAWAEEWLSQKSFSP